MGRLEGLAGQCGVLCHLSSTHLMAARGYRRPVQWHTVQNDWPPRPLHHYAYALQCSGGADWLKACQTGCNKMAVWQLDNPIPPISKLLSGLCLHHAFLPPNPVADPRSLPSGTLGTQSCISGGSAEHCG